MKRLSAARASISSTDASRVLLRDQDRPAQPRLVRDPALDLPAVHGVRQRDAEIEVALAARIPAQRNQHAVFDAVGIEMLALHHRQARARPVRLPRGRASTRAAIRRHPRIGQRLGERVTQMAAIGREMIDPALFEERMHFGPRRHRPDGCRSRSREALSPARSGDRARAWSCRRSPRAARLSPDADRLLCGLSRAILRISASDSPPGNASSPSNCQCG